jgi:hypothetical protein
MTPLKMKKWFIQSERLLILILILLLTFHLQIQAHHLLLVQVAGPITVTVPTNLTLAADDVIEVVYAADGYAGTNTYFAWKNAADANAEVGALRQGQVEIYMVDPSDLAATDFENAWRLTGVTISADLTREPLTELGHLGPYDRPLTLPIPITVTVDSTAGDLENWAKFAGQDFDGDLDDIDLNDLMNKDNLILVAKVFEQTDEEAGGTGAARKALIEDVGWRTAVLRTARFRQLTPLVLENML